MVYCIARTTIDGKKIRPEIDRLYLYLYPPRPGAVPVYLCRMPHAALLAPRRAHERGATGRRLRATKEFPALGSSPVVYGFPRQPIIQPLDNFSKMTMPSIPNAVAHATASAPATIMRLYPSRFTTPPTPMIPMLRTLASACDWRISLNPTTFLDKPTQRTP